MSSAIDLSGGLGNTTLDVSGATTLHSTLDVTGKSTLPIVDISSGTINGVAIGINNVCNVTRTICYWKCFYFSIK